MEKPRFNDRYSLYFLRFTSEDGQELVKVGVTDDISRRITELGGARRFDLEDSYLLEGERSRIKALERHLHARHQPSRDQRDQGFLAESKEVFDATIMEKLLADIAYEQTHYPEALGELKKDITTLVQEEKMSHVGRLKVRSKSLDMDTHSLDEALEALQGLDAKLTLHLDAKRHIHAISGVTQKQDELILPKPFQQEVSQNKGDQKYFFIPLNVPSSHKAPGNKELRGAQRYLLQALQNLGEDRVETKPLDSTFHQIGVRKAQKEFFEEHLGAAEILHPAARKPGQLSRA